MIKLKQLYSSNKPVTKRHSIGPVRKRLVVHPRVAVRSPKAQLPPHGGKTSNTVARPTLQEGNRLQIESIHPLFNRKVTVPWSRSPLGLAEPPSPETRRASAAPRFRGLAQYPGQTLSKSLVMNTVEGRGRGSVVLSLSAQKGHRHLTGAFLSHSARSATPSSTQLPAHLPTSAEMPGMCNAPLQPTPLLFCSLLQLL